MTKASFDTISGLLMALVGIIMLKTDYANGNWWLRVLHIALAVAGCLIFNDGYRSLPKR
jgi:hypothetical protein